MPRSSFWRVAQFVRLLRSDMPGFIPDSTLAEIKARIDLPDLVRSYGIDLRRSGADFGACCPFHHEKTPSFVIHPDYFHCFGCGESGDAFKFVMKMEGLGFTEAVDKLARQCGVEMKMQDDDPASRRASRLRARLLELHAELAAFFRRCLKSAPEAQPARDYMARRDLSDDVAERFAIGYAPISVAAMQKWAHKYGFTEEEMCAAGIFRKSDRFPDGRPFYGFGGRLMFTIRDRSGRPIAFSGRILTNDKTKAKYYNSPETEIFKKSRVLFALDQAVRGILHAPRREAIVCEGQIDVIRCHACGFNTAVASQGTAFGVEHVQLLGKFADSVVLVFDADGAGQKAAIKVGGEFLAAEMPVRVATLPSGEDPDSLLRDKGPDAFRACLDRAESITGFQIRALRAQEHNPDSIDAMARVSRAALDTISKCPSAVMRAALLTEAAQLLGVPQGALEEDFEKAKAASAHRAPRLSAVPRRTETPSPAASEDPNDDDFLDPSRVPDAEPPSAEPPLSPLERALCELLFAYEGNPQMNDLAAEHMPDAVLRHEFTRSFARAWRERENGTVNSFAALRAELSTRQCGWLDEIMLGRSPTELSELSPDEMMRRLLRRLWAAALRQVQGRMSAESTPENDMRRLTFSTNIRTIERGNWERAVALMDVSMLT
jgi:DNA primase